MGKKTLLVTKIGKNYGALLQAYALKTTLDKFGCETHVLNYSLQATQNTYRPLPQITDIHTLKRFLLSLKRIRSSKKSIQRFLDFRNQYLNLTEEYLCFEELENNPPQADIYFTGSDQVWNPQINFDKAYYLMFGNKNVIRASYAASIGLKVLPDGIQDEFVKRLSNIKYKSVREESTKKILEELKIESTVHVDPTLLLNVEDYSKIENSVDITTPYVLLYLLIIPEQLEAYIAQVRKLFPNCKLVSIPGSTFAKSIGDIELGNIGPEEFLGAIKNAEAVLTTSFHGTVFSVIYKKNFMSILPAHTGGRISDLLECLNISNRIAKSPEDLVNIHDAINYTNVEEKISQLQESAFSYISMVIDSA